MDIEPSIGALSFLIMKQYQGKPRLETVMKWITNSRLFLVASLAITLFAAGCASNGSGPSKGEIERANVGGPGNPGYAIGK